MPVLAIKQSHAHFVAVLSKWGERVTAVITLSDEAEPSLESLDQFLADRLARYKRPKALYVVDELPRNPAGKVQKFALRDELSAV